MDYDEIIFNLIKRYDNISKCNFYELAKPFEYYSAKMLSIEYNKPIYHYNDLEMIYKEDNNLSKHDSGIDLTDKLDIIGQVKLRSDTLSWKELSTFICQINQFDSITKKRYIKWNDPILIRNQCSKISKNLKEHLNNNICIDRPYRLEEFYKYCNNLKTNPPLIKDTNDIIEIRDYQVETIDLINNNPTKNLYICLPTGSGKSYIVISSIELNKKYIILVPFVVLLDQWYSEIINIRPELTDYIQLIGDNNNTFDSNKLITISTFHSVGLVGNLNTYYRVVIDEAHKIIKPEIYEEVDDGDEEDEEDESTYTSIITKNIIGFHNNILMSATLDNPYNEDDIYHKVELRDLIDKGVLTDYQIKIPIFEDNANDISVCQYIVKNYTNMIIYCSSQEEGKRITDILNKISKKCCYYLDCNTCKGTRRDILKEFNNGNINFLVNIRILVEGFNSKICNGVILYHIAKNDKTLVQIIGRALRKHPNKLYANIVLPFINCQDSKDLQFILRVLATNDSVIKQRCITQKLGGYIDIEPIDKPIADNDDRQAVNDNQILMEAKFELVYNNIGNCVKGTVDMWAFKLEKLKKFIDDNKKTPNQKSEKSSEKILGAWLSSQKEKYKKQIMLDESVKLLWEKFNEDYKEYLLSNEEIWERHLFNVKKFIDDNEKAPSQKSKEKHEKVIGQWLSDQKKNYKKNIQILSKEYFRKQFEKFNEDYKEYLLTPDELWEYNLSKLIKFIDDNEHLPRQISTVIEEKKLHVWMSHQKRNHKNNVNFMKNIVLKNQWVKFIDNYKYLFLSTEETWKSNFNKVKQFINDNRKKPSSKSKDPEEQVLGRWVFKQQSKYKDQSDGSDDSEIRKLWESFVAENYTELFVSNTESWKINLAKLKQFLDDNEKLPSNSSQNPDEKQLKGWFSNQKSKFKSETEIMKDPIIRALWQDFIDEYLQKK
jgi:superfamily II DNA or RNA helicase|tara:strand:- start:1539 stop:4361 length:2823 start_codon:yes stop_codon:yes gene_type:complete